MDDKNILDLFFARDEDAIRHTDAIYGSRVELFSSELREPIDLTQADHLLLADGTKLIIPEA